MKTIDGVILKQMIISGANNLYNNYPEVDALNVFPVPDGDTGTNMNLTMATGEKEVFTSNDSSIYNVAKAFAKGLLLGARGNSGVILSQIFRGFTEGLKDKDKVDAIELANAFVMGKETAYKAVMRPVEGTILTVIREASTALYDRVEKDMSIATCLDILLEEAVKSLNRTPELLPVLKEVGVVDSGGAGLVKILEGFSKALHNEIVEKNMPTVTESVEPYSSGKPFDLSAGKVQAKFAHDKEFGYCTQFLLSLADQENLKGKKLFNEKRFQAVLEAHGNSIVFAKVEDIVKVHVHTLMPGTILTYAQQFGEFKMIKIDNMSEQHEELLLEDKEMKERSGQEVEEGKIEVTTSAAPTENKEEIHEPKELGIIAVAVGSGIEEMFKEASVDMVVSGGQTMNPSTDDFVKAIKVVNAKNVIIFPNNGNIVMAAKQAGEIMSDEGYNVTVIPTKTIPEGLIACMVFNPQASIEENVEAMEDIISGIKSGEITYAIKDTTIDGVTVSKDHFMGISGKKIVCCHKHKLNTLFDLLSSMIDEDSEIATIICGEDVTEEEKEKIEAEFAKKFSEDVELEIKEGNQPVYSFFVSVE